MLRQLYILIVAFFTHIPAFAIDENPLKFTDSLNNSLKIVTFHDTVYDANLPSIEFDLGTYHNFGDATTVGFKVILRGDEIEINDAALYKEAPEYKADRPMRTRKPFHIKVGDPVDRRRIDHVYVQLKFPYSKYFSDEDSLVISTNKGDYTIYMNEKRRADARYMPVVNKLKDDLSAKNDELVETRSSLSTSKKALLIVLWICVLGAIVIYMIIKRNRIRQTNEMNRLLCLISENEMDNRRLKSAVSDLMRKHFETINRLCGDYFEMADTPALKKIIYNKVETEINRLKEPKSINALEQTINQYCDNVMVRIDEQLPDLSAKERLLLIYLYSGMSARTICVLTDIQLKNFYMRRQRLKSKILASDALDKEFFADMM